MKEMILILGGNKKIYLTEIHSKFSFGMYKDTKFAITNKLLNKLLKMNAAERNTLPFRLEKDENQPYLWLEAQIFSRF